MATLSEKVWDRHVVHSAPGEPDLLYIDLHLVHEVTSRRPSTGCAWRAAASAGPTSRSRRWTTTCRPPASTNRSRTRSPRRRSRPCPQLRGVRDPLLRMGDPLQGIVHIIGPEQGLTQPGMTIVCGDSHTSTHGAFGALVVGIGTSEVEHVLATQTLPQMRPGTMSITVDGDLPLGVTANVAAVDREIFSQNLQ